MIDTSVFRDTLALYEKHGWQLARLLLTEEPSPELSSLAGSASVHSSAFDAAWFTRSSQPGTTTWELRYLGPSPLALVSVVGEDADLEAELEFQQERLVEMVSRKMPSEERKNGTS
ncbi:MAG: hypothetical protein IT171_07880 [Acidobacteria bacterium]|nr:hypothetical protein [Pyrinomonadaceae bacterium]MCC6452798.1 hypothetical protein [Acidobacteriota bacterium]